MIARLRTWWLARADRRLVARMVREANAAIEARGRGDLHAYRRHASLAQALSARRHIPL